MLACLAGDYATFVTIKPLLDVRPLRVLISILHLTELSSSNKSLTLGHLSDGTPFGFEETHGIVSGGGRGAVTDKPTGVLRVQLST